MNTVRKLTEYKLGSNISVIPIEMIMSNLPFQYRFKKIKKTKY